MQIPSAAESVSKMVEACHGIAASHESMEIQIGKVIAAPPDLKIAVNDIVLDKKDLYVDIFLLKGYYRKIKGHIESGTQPASCPIGAPHTHPIDNDYEATLYTVDTLKAGDLVTCVPVKGGQKFIVLGRVVYLPEYGSDPHG